MTPRLTVRQAELQQFLRFNLVGILGTAVQLTILCLFTRGLRMEYLGATALAVEIALLHNFVWHETWTWKGLPVRRWPVRLVRFHLGNGVTSIVSNVVLTFFFHRFLRLSVIPANLAAITTAALLNFWLARFWVFRVS